MGGLMMNPRSVFVELGSTFVCRLSAACPNALVGAVVLLSCEVSCQSPGAPAAEAPPASTVKEDVGATSPAVPAAAPAAARALPAFCQGANAESPVPASARAELVKDGFVFVE